MFRRPLNYAKTIETLTRQGIVTDSSSPSVQDSAKTEVLLGENREGAPSSLINSKNHRPGRELDALIAERVMGYHREGQPPDYDGQYVDEPVLLPPGTSWKSLFRQGYALPPKGLIGLGFFVPRFSTELDASWKVVELLSDFAKGRKHPWWSVAVFHCQRNQVGCRVYAGSPGHNLFDTETIIAEEVASTAQLAICLAALRAVDA